MNNREYTISEWCGRFGNNIQQISNSIYFCKKNNFKFISPPHEFINSFSVDFGPSPAPSGIYFFYNTSETGQGGPNFICDEKELNNERKKICEEYILPNLKFDTKNICRLEQDTCVIHIRSGDIFNKENYYCPVISKYLQNPLSYYKYIISKYKKCICIAEDENNPVVKELKKIKNVIVCRSTFEDDFRLLLSATNFATSGVSTFSIAAALLSKTIKNLHVTDIFLKEHLNPTMLNDKINVLYTHIEQEKYIKNGEWINSPMQRQKMLEYSQTYE